jgi:hypothetical protein
MVLGMVPLVLALLRRRVHSSHRAIRYASLPYYRRTEYVAQKSGITISFCKDHVRSFGLSPSTYYAISKLRITVVAS